MVYLFSHLRLCSLLTLSPFIAYSSAVNIEASPVSLPPLVVLGNTAAKPMPSVDLEPSV